MSSYVKEERKEERGIVGRGRESLAEAGSEHEGAFTDAGSDDCPEVGKGECVDDVISANSSKQDKDEGSGNKGSSDLE